MDIVLVDVPQESFTKTLERYLDDSKPDRHVREQMQSWNFRWNPSPSSTTAVEAQAERLKDLPFQPTHLVSGDLVWEGEYVKLTLNVFCCWEGAKKDGSIYFLCDCVRGEFAEAPTTDESFPEKEVKAAKRVHQKMIERLQKDDYIKKLIKGDRRTFLQATVSIKSRGELEERVYCDEDTAEAIRRGLFTTAENRLDVFDWMMYLPILPSVAHEGQVSVTTPLADRVKLRFLEEATCDACDQEGEEELVEELHISKKTKAI